MGADKAEPTRREPDWDTYHYIYDSLKEGADRKTLLSFYDKRLDTRAKNILRRALRDGPSSLSDPQVKCLALSRATIVRSDKDKQLVVESNRVTKDIQKMNAAQLDEYLKG